jgi:hypothetical protein
MRVYLCTHPGSVTREDLFRAVAAPLVEHPMGWGGMTVVNDPGEADSVVTLTPGKVMDQQFPEFAADKLSVCDMSSGEVWLREERWRGEVPNGSRLALPAYRAYMVQHELGHARGLHHEACSDPNQPAPVMCQQTRGIGACTPHPFHHGTPPNAPSSITGTRQNAP